MERILSSRVFAWLFCAWVVAVAERYILRAIESAFRFFTTVQDVYWFAGALIVVVLLILATALFRPGIVAAVCGGVFVAAGAAIVCFSHLVGPFALAVSILLMTCCLGRYIMKPLFGPEASDALLFVCGAPAGLTLIALLTFCTGLAGVLTRPACWTIFAIGACALIATIRSDGCRLADRSTHSLFKSLRTCSRESALLLAVIGSVSLLSFVWAVAPEVEFDALNYHLAVPRLYLDHHRVLELDFYHSYFAHNLEVLFAWVMALGGAEAVKFVMFGLSVVSVFATYLLGSQAFGRRTGLWAAALFSTAPLVAWEAGTVSIENVVALCVTGGLLAFVRWLDAGKSGFLVAGALLAGAAIGSKLNAAFAFAVAAPVVIWKTARDSSYLYLDRFRGLLYAGAAFSIAGLPTYALLAWYTGNPVFPHLNGLFRSPKWAMDNTITNSGQFGTAATIGFLLRLPARLTLDTHRYAEFMPDGGIGFTMLLVAPFGLLLLASRRKGVRLLAGSVLAYLLLLFYTMQYARYVLLVLPVAAVLGAGLASYVSDAKLAALIRVALFTGAVLQFPVLIAVHWQFEDRFPVSVATGIEEREEFLKRVVLGYSAADYLNRVADPKDAVLTAGLENLRYYMKPPLRTVYLAPFTDPLRDAQRPLSPADAYEVLRRNGISWLMFPRPDFDQKPPDRASYLDPEFLLRYAKLEFTNREVKVYRLLQN